MEGSYCDNDLYKFYVLQAILEYYPRVWVKFRLFNRSNTPINLHDLEVFCETPPSLTSSELVYFIKLGFSQKFLDYIKHRPAWSPEIYLARCEDNENEFEVEGYWDELTLLEVPLLTEIHKQYYKNSKYHSNDYRKNRLEAAGNLFSIAPTSDFGTRRRVSYKLQEAIAIRLNRTSNVDLAIEHGLTAVGTIPHEWFMAHQVLAPFYKHTKVALKTWFSQGNAKRAVLTDTITTFEGFFKFLGNGKEFSQIDGFRHDSGDPVQWLSRITSYLKANDLAYETYQYIFSNSVDSEVGLRIRKEANTYGKPLKLGFGIGGFLSGAVEDNKYVGPNIAFKLVEVEGLPVAKLSDTPSKATCTNPEYVSYLKKLIS